MVEDPKRHDEVVVFTGKKDMAQPDLGTLPPGYVIEFADIRELVAFEDLIAAEVDPKHDPALWATRSKLSDLIRPKKVKIHGENKPFIGTIRNIKLVVMADPYERLLDAGDRGWSAQDHAEVGIKHKLDSDIAESLIPRYRGFSLIADATQSGSGKVGRIQAELWYFPYPPKSVSGKTWQYTYKVKSGEIRHYSHTYKEGNSYRRGTHEGKALRRVVTHPRMKTDKFIQVYDNSQRVAEAVLKHNLTHPLPTPMRK